MKHVWISNAAFTRATGIKKVCMTCGTPSNNAPSECPGKRPEAQAARS